MGVHPCVFTEIGIPYDMDDKYAYKTGNYSSQIAALDANHFALEDSQANGFALWTYVTTVGGRLPDVIKQCSQDTELALLGRPMERRRPVDLFERRQSCTGGCLFSVGLPCVARHHLSFFFKSSSISR
jgi:hypothetical protein